MARKLIVTIIALIGIIAMVVAGCGGGGNGGGGPIPYLNDGIFIQDTIGDIPTLDPAWSYDTASGEQISYIYETLIYYAGNDTGNFINVLADNYTVVNQTQMKFHIRSGVKFSNNATLIPDDVEYSIERVMVHDRAGGPAWMFYAPLLGVNDSGDLPANVTGYTDYIDPAIEVDGEWVVFDFADPFPSTIFLQILCNGWGSIVNKQWCKDNGDWNGTAEDWLNWNRPARQDSYLFNHAMGTGPWKLDVLDPNVQIKLAKNDAYWRGAETVPFDYVITKTVNTWTQRKLDLLNGEADLVYVDPSDMTELLGNTELNIYAGLGSLTCDAFFFNFNISASSPYIGSGAYDGDGIPTNFFQDPAVRKGFSYAFDYDTYIADIHNNEAAQLGSPVVNGIFGYNPSASKYSFCLTLAKQYLESTTLWGNLSATGFKFTLAYNIGNAARKACCDIMAEGLAQVSPNFQVSVLPLAWSVFLDEMSMDPPINMPIYRLGWLADYPDPDNFVTPFMHSSGTFSSFQMYSNSTIDAMIETARVMENNATRQALYYQLQQAYHDQAPGIMLVQTLGRRFFTKYIHGFYYNPMISGLPGPLYYMTKSNP